MRGKVIKTNTLLFIWWCEPDENTEFSNFQQLFYYRFLPNLTYLKIFWARCLQSKMMSYSIVSLINHRQTGCHRNIRSRKILCVHLHTTTRNIVDLISLIISHPLESTHKCTALHESTDVCAIMNACIQTNLCAWSFASSTSTPLTAKRRRK